MSIDKAVSTEDLCTEEDASSTLGVLRLEAILNTLVENKVEALKQENGKPNSLHSSPKSILQKLKYQQSSPKTTFRIENESKRRSPKRRERKERSGHQTTTAEKRQFKKQVLRQETSSPESPISSVDDKHLINGQSYIDVGATEDDCSSRICYCNHNPNMQMTDDYISIKMDGYGDIETDAIIAQEEIKRARRKRRRRRRKKRLKKRLALNAHLVDTLGHETEFKTLHDDELPPRAKWTIVATACLLLFMCLLLVGITLRMAPIIDEIGTFLSPPISREALKRLNSTSSHSSASDWSPGTPCEVQEKPLVRGQRHLKKAISLEEIFYKKGNKKRKHLQRRTSDYNIKSYEITLERKSSKRRKRSSRSKNSNSTRDTSQGQCDIESGHLDNNIMFANSSKNLSKQSPRSKVQEDIQQSIEEVSRHKRRRRIINIILAVYFFIFCISILSVVVTLTHQSTTTIIGKNSTKNLTYYTFSPKSDVLLEDIS